MHPFDLLMSENIQGLLLSINELATSAAAEGNEIRLVAACEVLRNSGAESLCWIASFTEPEEGYPEALFSG
ncbi:hypothetical protein SynBIOSE41_03141 [Synechococcus sp. BIOS-E4-1]|uniref:hypothetical protein n=1 Tax=Synechococcus sp. BIOS-E4-1 TaxID=1400864 RepID=UPI0016496020|nr:hypothetical protein [Synechococcus sp. BIOS-E4-1]QNI55624.1 hypothetical protein SynBIOSE41_03141 [Synechococcus sp. BIOS-E4-1]